MLFCHPYLFAGIDAVQPELYFHHSHSLVPPSTIEWCSAIDAFSYGENDMALTSTALIDPSKCIDPGNLMKIYIPPRIRVRCLAELPISDPNGTEVVINKQVRDLGYGTLQPGSDKDHAEAFHMQLILYIKRTGVCLYVAFYYLATIVEMTCAEDYGSRFSGRHKAGYESEIRHIRIRAGGSIISVNIVIVSWIL